MMSSALHGKLEVIEREVVQYLILHINIVLPQIGITSFLCALVCVTATYAANILYQADRAVLDIISA